MTLFGTLTAQDKLIRARVQIQNSNPFFAYMSLYLKFVEDEKLSSRKTDKGEETFLAGVDAEGHFYYNKKSIEELPDNELQGLVIHEILHLTFLHLTRRGTRDHELFNIAADIVCNNIIVNNNYALPKKGIIPYKNTIELKDDKGKCFCKIEKINEKTVEQVFDELMKHVKMINVQMTKAADGKGNTGFGFDLHIEGSGGKPITEKEKKEIEKQWLERVADATNSARMRGNMPAGMELQLGQLHTQKVDWKHILRQHIQSQIPYDQTYCLDKDTLIKVDETNSKPIKDIKIGDIILGEKAGKIVKSKVLNTFKTNIDEKYIIYTKLGKRIICSKNHKFLTKSGKYLEPKDLNRGDILMSI